MKLDRAYLRIRREVREHLAQQNHDIVSLLRKERKMSYTTIKVDKRNIQQERMSSIIVNCRQS